MKRLILLLFLASMVSVLGAQPRMKVTGKVTEADGQGIPGVSILVKGTMVGTITDGDGNYTIEPKLRALWFLVLWGSPRWRCR